MSLPSVVWLLGVGCSGVVAAPELVLYAGHCGEDVHGILLETGEIVRPQSCKLHPGARPGFATDIAFCKTSERLATGQMLVAKPGGDLVAYGYGSPVGAGTRQRSFPAGFAGYSKFGSFVAHVAHGDFCGGDSGGPVFKLDGVLVGIASAAADRCNHVETTPRIMYSTPLVAVREWLAREAGVTFEIVDS